MVFDLFEILSKNFWLLLENTWTVLSILHFTYPEKRSEKKTFLWKLLPLVFFGDWEKSFRHSGINFQKVLWKVLSTCPSDILEETFLLKIFCFWSSLENESKVFRLLSTFSTWKLNLLFTCPWDLFQETYVSEETVFPPFGKKFQKVLWKLLYTCPWDKFEEKSFFNKDIFL